MIAYGGGSAGVSGWDNEDSIRFSKVCYSEPITTPYGMWFGAFAVHCVWYESDTIMCGGTMGEGLINSVVEEPTDGGSDYTAADVLTVTTGGTGGKVTVATVSEGVVTAITLLVAGTGYTAAAAKATSGGTGTGCTIEIDGVAVAEVGDVDTLITAVQTSLDGTVWEDIHTFAGQDDTSTLFLSVEKDSIQDYRPGQFFRLKHTYSAWAESTSALLDVAKHLTDNKLLVLWQFEGGYKVREAVKGQ